MSFHFKINMCMTKSLLNKYIKKCGFKSKFLKLHMAYIIRHIFQPLQIATEKVVYYRWKYIYIYIYIFDPELYGYSRTPIRGSHGPKG